MTLPTSAYLRALIASIHGDPGMPLEIRNECHRLMQAIDANDAALIAASVERIERLAAKMSIDLPAAD
jgi:hypothetical protein